MTQNSFTVKGMSCQGCVGGVLKTLSNVTGLTQVKVDLASEMASAEFAENVSSKEIVEKLSLIKKSVETTDEIYDVIGMTCAGCAETVRKKIESHPRVVSAEVSLAANLVKITIIKGLGVDSTRLLDGTHYRLSSQSQTALAEKSAKLPSDLIIGLFATIPLFVLSMTADLIKSSDLAGSSVTPWVMGLLGTIVQFSTGRIYFRGAYEALKLRTANMDVLVAMGSTVAWASSVAVLLGLMKGHLYFESAAVILVLVRVGKWIEEKARSSAKSNLKSLFELSVKEARVINQQNVQLVPLSSVRVGMSLRVLPGEKIPLDGILISGRSSVNESLVTGEGVPQSKAPGDNLTGGTMNLTSSIDYQVSHTSEEGLIAQIIRQVISAQSSRSRLGDLADQISKYFVPAIILTSIFTGTYWWLIAHDPEAALLRLTSVLVVACPCALGLATPSALMVGLSQAAREGILIRSLKHLEVLAKTRTLVLDKTGTLTEGNYEVIEPPTIEIQTKNILGALASHSNHPVSQAIVRWGKGSLELTDIQETPGKGIQGSFQGQTFYLGSPKWYRELILDKANQPEESSQFQINPNIPQGESGSNSYLTQKNTPAGESHSVVFFFSQDRSIFVEIKLADRLREDAKLLVDNITNRNVELVIISGDRTQVVRDIAEKLGIQKWFSEVSPIEKVSLLSDLPRPVAMMGDGLNDAASLAKADAGIAVASGTELAKTTAGIVLFSDKLTKVIRLFDISKMTVQTVNQNLIWAFIYNLALIPLSMGLFHGATWVPEFLKELNPMMAALAMSASSLSVVMNSLVLKSRLQKDAENLEPIDRKK